MKNTLTSLAIAGALALGLTGCEKRSPSDVDLAYRLELHQRRNYETYHTENMENEYPKPQDLQFQVRDMNQDGKYELVVSFKDKNYLVKQIGTNELRFVPYEKKIDIVEKP